MEPAKRASALAHDLEGVGLRATERLVGVSHNAVMNWELEAVESKTLEWIQTGSSMQSPLKMMGMGTIIHPSKSTVMGNSFRLLSQ